MIALRVVILAVSLLFAGCAKGFHRGQLDAALQLSSPRYTSSALSVEEIEKLQPQIKLPIRLAVTPPLFASRYRWRSNQGDSWSPDELSEIESWEQRLRSAGIVHEAVILPSVLVEGCKQDDPGCVLRARRAAAARVQADALLILNVATEVDEYANPASILDLTLVGLWVIPGHHVNALTIVEGAMIDNRNEYLYVLARGEGEERMLRPFAYVRAEAAEQGSRRRALASFGEVFVHEASQLKTG
jgi:hypothetical protein